MFFMQANPIGAPSCCLYSIWIAFSSGKLAFWPFLSIFQLLVCHMWCLFSVQTCNLNYFVLFIWNLQCTCSMQVLFSSLIRLFLAIDIASAVHVLHANSHSSPLSFLMLFMSFVVHLFHENLLWSQLEFLHAFLSHLRCTFLMYVQFQVIWVSLAICMAFTVHVLHLNTHSSHFEVFPDIYMSFATIVHQENSHSSNFQLFNSIYVAFAMTFFMQIRNQAISNSFLIFICHLQLEFIMQNLTQEICSSFLIFIYYFQWCSSCKFGIKPFWALSCY